MQLTKIKSIVVLVFILAFTVVVYAEPIDSWKGYGLFELNESEIIILSEDVCIEPINDILQYQGEFLLKNQKDGFSKAVLGVPAQGIERIVITDRGNNLKWKKRSIDSLQNEFNMDIRFPQEDFWYVFEITLSPWETRVINIQLNALQQKNTDGSYSLTYFNNGSQGLSNQIQKSSLFIEIPDFQPYNIMSLTGVEASEIGVRGDIVLNSDKDSTAAIEIKYSDITSIALKNLQGSVMRRPKEIAKEFSNKNYEKVSRMCDEYLNSPIDSQLTKDQVLFFKAESLRRLSNYEGYLKVAEALDYNDLYPSQLKYKIAYDKIMIYVKQQDQEKLNDSYKMLEQDTSDEAKILMDWIQHSSLFNAATIKKDNIFTQLNQGEKNVEVSDTLIVRWYKAAVSFKYTPLIIFIAGIIIGLGLKKISFKRKKKKSMYIYRM